MNDDELLMRVGDVLRRSHVHDAELLVRELEKRLVQPIFSVGGEGFDVFACSAVFAEGEGTLGGETIDLFTARASAFFATDRRFPYHVLIREAHVRIVGAPAESFVLELGRNGITLARWPLGRFTGRRAVEFLLDCDPHVDFRFEARALSRVNGPFSIVAAFCAERDPRERVLR